MRRLHGYLVKLVRDGIPHALDGDGTVTYGPIDHETHVRLLRQKLLEEVGEYLLEPSAEELADVLAVLRALASVDLEVSWHDVELLELDKHGVRGGFTEGTGMYALHPADERERLRIAQRPPERGRSGAPRRDALPATGGPPGSDCSSP